MMLAESLQQAGAAQYERTDARKTQRSGYMNRTLRAPYGNIVLQCPQPDEEANKGYHSEKTLTIYHDNTKIYEVTIPQHFTEIKAPLSLQEGMNIIHLEVLEGCNKPSEGGNSSDDRCLSIAVQDVRLEEGETKEEVNW